MSNIDIVAAEDFTYSRTLERHLVNRRFVSEVFLTDFHPVDQNSWIVGAQLPVGHAYFSDHTTRPKFYDPLLILECCRQAGTYGGYTQFGSPLDTINMVSSMQLEITAPERLRIGTSPGRLVIHVEAVDIVRTGTRTKRATPQMTLFLDGENIGNASIPVNLASPKLFRALRSRTRQGPPALTNSLALPTNPLAEPSRVGRSRRSNVLIAGMQRLEDEAHAVLSLSPENTNILDHDYDHIPAMALVDAAVQLMTWDTQLHRHAMTCLNAHFERFTEVDAPVSLVGTHRGTGEYTVAFHQSGSTTGSIALRLTNDPTLVDRGDGDTVAALSRR